MTKEFTKALTEQLVAAHIYGQYNALRTVMHRKKKFGPYEDAVNYIEKRVNLSSDAIASLKSKYGPIASSFASVVDKKLENAVMTGTKIGVVEGLHVKGTQQAIANELLKSGIGKSSYLVETWSRTNTNMAYNAGRWGQLQDPDLASEIWGFEYIAIDDDRVRADHLAMNGATYPKDDPFWASNWPPNGWNCRCTTIEVFDPPDNYQRQNINAQADPGFDFNSGQIGAETKPLPAPATAKEIKAVTKDVYAEAKKALEKFDEHAILVKKTKVIPKQVIPKQVIPKQVKPIEPKIHKEIVAKQSGASANFNKLINDQVVLDEDMIAAKYSKMESTLVKSGKLDEAISAYVSDVNTNINKHLRAGTLTGTPYEVNANTLSSFCKSAVPLSDDVVTYRGVRGDIFRGSVGDTIELKGFSSTSLDIDAAKSYFDTNGVNTIYQIEARKGAKGVLAGFNDMEYEILFDHKSKFKVLDSVMKGNTKYVRLQYEGV